MFLYTSFILIQEDQTNKRIKPLACEESFRSRSTDATTTPPPPHGNVDHLDLEITDLICSTPNPFI